IGPRPPSRRRPSRSNRRWPAQASTTCRPPRGRSMPDVVIVNSGVANLASITSAFRRLGTSVVVTDDPGVVAAARRVVLPGVTAVAQAGLVDSGVAAFANSYALQEAPPGWTPAWTTHGVRFVAALEQGRILACQFHPELSGAWGAALLERWLAGATVAPSATAGEGPAPGLLPRVVPCLDVRDGRVVKGVRFQHLRDA